MQTQGRRHANVQPHVFHHFFAIHLARVAELSGEIYVFWLEMH